ncbi:tannase and feruloyl esterase-domain-containing protein, partial [Colletotrichum phormii]
RRVLCRDLGRQQRLRLLRVVSLCHHRVLQRHLCLLPRRPRGDKVHVTYWVPSPDAFQNRYVSTGGGGLAINSGSQYIPTGIIVGAVSGITDGGFGDFNTQWDAVFLAANGTVNWQSVYMFGYQAHNELATLGKEFTKKFYSVAADQKTYSHYQGCSEGGREGWSQAQRFADQFDGLTIGAPAFRYGQQQVNHLTANVMEQTRNQRSRQSNANNAKSN